MILPLFVQHKHFLHPYNQKEILLHVEHILQIPHNNFKKVDQLKTIFYNDY